MWAGIGAGLVALAANIAVATQGSPIGFVLAPVATIGIVISIYTWFAGAAICRTLSDERLGERPAVSAMDVARAAPGRAHDQGLRHHDGARPVWRA